MIKNFMIFVSGAALGSLVTWQIIKTKYERIAQEEIDSVKEVYSKRRAESEDVEKENSNVAREKAEEARKKPSVIEYAAKLKEHGYTNYSNLDALNEEVESEKENEEEEETSVDRPYVISPDEFDSKDDYDTVSLTYYSDKIVADRDDEIVEDVEEIIGFESLNHFGEFEDDSVFVRNDRLKIDYEILLDQRTYAEVMKGRSQ